MAARDNTRWQPAAIDISESFPISRIGAKFRKRLDAGHDSLSLYVSISISVSSSIPLYLSISLFLSPLRLGRLLLPPFQSVLPPSSPPSLIAPSFFPCSGSSNPSQARFSEAASR